MSYIKNNLFCYAIDETALAAGGTSTPVIVISNDSAFLVVEFRAVIMFAATGIDATTASVTYQASLSSGELFSNTAINLLSLAAVQNVLAANNTGNYTGYPIRLPGQQMLIPANSKINVALTNNAGGAVQVQVQYWGKKVDKSLAE